MSIYLVVSVTLILLGLFYETTNRLTIERYNKVVPMFFYTLPSFLILFFLSTFRGDFTTDYKNYSARFEITNRYDFAQIFDGRFNIESGYLFVNKVIGSFTDNPIYLFAFMTLVILVGHFSHFKKYSVNVWLSIVLFATIGSYYSSFNITRQILSVAIVFAGSKYLYERKFWKFLLFIGLSYLFHKSAIIMIPFYFILNFRLKLTNLLMFFIGTAVLTFTFDNVLDFAQNFIYDNYTESSYGMSGQLITNLVLPLSIFIFSLFNIRKLDPNNNMHKVWFNATFFYFAFNVLAMQVEMVKRFGTFFAPFVLLLIPFILSKTKDKNLRVVYTLGLIVLSVAYNFVVLSNSVFDPYYFIWDK